MKEKHQVDFPASQKKVPRAPAVRKKIREYCRKISDRLGREEVASKDRLRFVAARALKACGLGREYLGYAMVQVSNAYSEKRFAAVPFAKRLLLLPRCLSDSKHCRGEKGPVQLRCRRCGRCLLDLFIGRAEKLGYAVLVAEGTPVVGRLLLEKGIGGVLGVSCLTSMEKAFQRVQESGLPSVSVPLLFDGCRDTKVDAREVLEYLEMHSGQSASISRRKIVDNLARSIFLKAMERYPEPECSTGAIAKKYILAGGKRLRPFLTVSVYSALAGDADIPDHVYRCALAIELFHKASLVHDDLEDGSSLRDGRPTLHKRYDEGIAINIGDYIIALGYNFLVATGNFQVMQIIARVHKKMAEAQGDELLWYFNGNKKITAQDVIVSYEKKTAEAYKAAVLTGAVLAGASPKEVGTLARYSMKFGVAFQIKDDIDDMVLGKDGRFKSSSDISQGHPTIFFALALEKLGRKDKARLLRLMSQRARNASEAREIYEFYLKAGAIEAAARVMKKFSDEAEKEVLNLKAENLRTILKMIKDRALG